MTHHNQTEENLPGHITWKGTDVELVFYRQNERLTILVNKAGICRYRCTIPNAFAEGELSSAALLNFEKDTFVLRYL